MSDSKIVWGSYLNSDSRTKSMKFSQLNNNSTKSFGSRKYRRLVQSEDEAEEGDEEEGMFLQSSTSDDDYFALV